MDASNLISTRVLIITHRGLNNTPAKVIVGSRIFRRVRRNLFLTSTPRRDFRFRTTYVTFLRALPLIRGLMLTTGHARLNFRSVKRRGGNVVMRRLQGDVRMVPVVICMNILRVRNKLFRLSRRRQGTVSGTRGIHSTTMRLQISLRFFCNRRVVIFQIFRISRHHTSSFNTTVQPLSHRQSTVPRRGVLFLVSLRRKYNKGIYHRFLLRLIRLIQNRPQIRPRGHLPGVPNRRRFPVTNTTRHPIQPRLFKIMDRRSLPTRGVLRRVTYTILSGSVFKMFTTREVASFCPAVSVGF